MSQVVAGVAARESAFDAGSYGGEAEADAAAVAPSRDALRCDLLTDAKL